MADGVLELERRCLRGKNTVKICDSKCMTPLLTTDLREKCRIFLIYIMQWNHTILNKASLNVYAEAIHNKGAALENYFGFIDGT